MSEVSDRYVRVADGFAARLKNVREDQWSAPTPCSEWAVRDLVAHVITTHRRMAALLDGTDAVPVDPNDDLKALWQEATAAARQAAADPARASTAVHSMFGDMPFETLVSGPLCTDTLVHTWDLARATGQDESLDPGAVEAATKFTAPNDERMRTRGAFGPKIEPAADADAQTRLLNFCGRKV